MCVKQWFLTFLKSGEHFWLYEKWNTKINDPAKQAKTSRVEINILLNIFKFYILKYIIKFLQSRDNNNKKKIRLS